MSDGKLPFGVIIVSYHPSTFVAEKLLIKPFDMKQILIGKIGLMLVVLIFNVYMGFKSDEYFKENKYMSDIEPNELLCTSIRKLTLLKYDSYLFNNEISNEETDLQCKTSTIELINGQSNKGMVQYISIKEPTQTNDLKQLCFEAIDSVMYDEDNVDRINNITTSIASDIGQSDRESNGLISVFNKGIIRLNPINI